jgi:hypothetical protein
MRPIGMNVRFLRFSSFSSVFKVSICWCTFGTRLSHFFTTACSDTLALGVDVCIKSFFCSHVRHFQRRRAALPRVPVHERERAQNDLRRPAAFEPGFTLPVTAVFNFEPGLRARYAFTPFSVMPAPDSVGRLCPLLMDIPLMPLPRLFFVPTFLSTFFRRAAFLCSVCSRSLWHYQTPGIICPVKAYAPSAAMTPSIARRPLSFSARSLCVSKIGVIRDYPMCV